MEVTVLGRHAPYPPAGGACSGYLIQSRGIRVLVDGGPGVAARLMAHGGVEPLDAVIVSHLHADHISDLHCLQFAVLAAQGAGRRAAALPVYCPQEPARNRAWLESVQPGWFDTRDLPAETGLRIGPLQFTCARTVHPIPCYAMRISDGESTLFYSADTSRDAAPGLLSLAAGADLALVEASLTEARADLRPVVGHMTAGDAAVFGRQAGVKRLLLTHIWPEVNLELLLGEARAEWAAAEMAEELRTYRVGE